MYNTLISDSQPLELWEGNVCCLSPPSLWCLTIAAWAGRDGGEGTRWWNFPKLSLWQKYQSKHRNRRTLGSLRVFSLWKVVWPGRDLVAGCVAVAVFCSVTDPYVCTWGFLCWHRAARGGFWSYLVCRGRTGSETGVSEEPPKRGERGCWWGDMTFLSVFVNVEGGESCFFREMCLWEHRLRISVFSAKLWVVR